MGVARNNQAAMAVQNVVVLIHGLHGDGNTWGGTDVFLEEGLGHRWEVVKFKYQTVWSKKNPLIEQIAIQLRNWLDNNYPGANLVLAGHSMGGLVAKEYILTYLRQSRKRDLRVKALILVAVPNDGAGIAGIVSSIPWIDKTQLGDLAPRRRRWWRFGRGSDHPTFLEIQRREWAGRINSKDPEYGEEGKYSLEVRTLYAVNDEYVPRESAQGPYQYAVPLPGNHTSVVKPRSREDELVRSMVSVIAAVTQAQEPPVELESSRGPCFGQAPKLADQVIHYIDPVRGFNEHYARFEQCLRQVSYHEGRVIRQHPLTAETPQHVVDLLARLLVPGVVVIVTPRGFEQMTDSVKQLISKHGSARVVFVDQEPPYSLLQLPNVCYVGPDNWLVGSLAALALAAHLRTERVEEATVATVDGPGGALRREGFVDTMQVFRNFEVLPPIRIRDRDRFETINDVRNIVLNHPDVAGFFAGNDETASAFVDAIEEYSLRGVVVGCDGTPEMRQLARRGGSALIDTVITDACGLAEEIVRICLLNDRARECRYKRPSLERFSVQVQDLIRGNRALEDWWPSGDAEWLPEPLGRGRRR